MRLPGPEYRVAPRVLQNAGEQRATRQATRNLVGPGSKKAHKCLFLPIKTNNSSQVRSQHRILKNVVRQRSWTIPSALCSPAHDDDDQDEAAPSTTPTMNVAPLARRPLSCLKANLRQARQQNMFIRQLATEAAAASRASQTPEHDFCTSISLPNLEYHPIINS